MHPRARSGCAGTIPVRTHPMSTRGHQPKSATAECPNQLPVPARTACACRVTWGRGERARRA
eukprot:2278972-Alexandrium_andersonii.AAC.1